MRIIAAVLGVSMLATIALAGPEWVEPKDMDAGSLPGTAQPTSGLGSFTSIRGTIAGLALAGAGSADLEDMYVICIDDPAAFLASTFQDQGGMSFGFNPRLYLFGLEGQGLLGNDDTALGKAGPSFSPAPAALIKGTIDPTLVNAADDGTGVIVDLSGLYLLTITAGPREPQSGGGPIFFFASSTEVSGPDGPGGGEEIIEWQPGAPVSGACCLSFAEAGNCIETDLETCQSFEGLYLGDYTICAACFPPALGACCFKGNCVDGYDAFTCQKEGGDYQGDGSECGKISCTVAGGGPPQIGDYVIALSGVCFANQVPVGACCLPGGCSQVTEVECDALGGGYQGDGSSCGGNCGQPVGACCFDDGSCAVLGPDACLEFGGVPQGLGTVCAVGICAQPGGACCFDDGTCTGGQTQAACNGQGGDWQGPGAPCVPGQCVPVKGACCFGPGSCAALTPANCAAAGGEYQGDDTVCTPGGCDGAGGACESAGGSDCDGNGVSDVCEIVTGQSPDNDGNGVPDKCQCPADLTGDKVVNVQDLVAVVEAWGTAEAAADVSGDGFVDVADLVAIIMAWGKCQ